MKLSGVDILYLIQFIFKLDIRYLLNTHYKRDNRDLRTHSILFTFVVRGTRNEVSPNSWHRLKREPFDYDYVDRVFITIGIGR